MMIVNEKKLECKPSGDIYMGEEMKIMIRR